MPNITMLDIQRKNGAPQRDSQIVDQVAFAAPVVTQIPAAVVKGTTYSYRRRKNAPKVGARPANAGVNVYKTDYEEKNDQCFIYNGRIEIDEMVANADAEGPGAYLKDEAESHTQGLMCSLEQSFFYGKAIAPYGMTGLVDTIGDYMTISADPDVNKTGKGAEGGASVWAIVNDAKMLRMIFGNSKAISFGPVRRGDATDKNGKEFTALKQDIGVWVGLSQRNEYAVARLINVSDDTGLTDSMLAGLLECFPTGYVPTMLVMNRHARSLLQKSRSTALVYPKMKGGTQVAYASLPTEYEGIPIVVTDALLNDETAENIAKLATESHIYTKNTAPIKR